MRKTASFFLTIALLLTLSDTGEAASVTDTLTVKVGYFGMSPENYVEVATYHWSELYDNLPLYQQAYSFYRDSGDGEYRVAIDSALGFGIIDLADYAGVYSGDVSAVLFYTKDQEVGSFTTFPAAELFSSRWYFDDLAANLTPIYSEDGAFEGYDETQAWQHATQVQPMLALEDSWVWYDIGTEHTAPNFSALGTGNRFRLLFGQNSPTECRTNQTAKYTHTVLFTLRGAPAYTEQPVLNSTIGSYTAQFTVSIDNAALRAAAATLLSFSSSNENTLQITGWSAEADDTYADLISITLHYDILAEGMASLQMGYGDTAGQPGPEVVVNGGESGAFEGSGSNDTPDSSESSGQAGNGENQAPTQSSEPTENRPPADPGQTIDPASQILPVTAEEQTIRLMNDRLVQQLRQKEPTPLPEQAPQLSALREKLPVRPDEPAPVLQTILGAAVLLLMGALCCIRYYQKERKHE